MRWEKPFNPYHFYVGSPEMFDVLLDSMLDIQGCHLHVDIIYTKDDPAGMQWGNCLFISHLGRDF
jgi:hypothetical protein